MRVSLEDDWKLTLEQFLDEPKRMIAYTDGSYSDGSSGTAYAYKIDNDEEQYVVRMAKLNDERIKQLNPTHVEMIAILKLLEEATNKNAS